jgi:hypothetical protein
MKKSAHATPQLHRLGNSIVVTAQQMLSHIRDPVIRFFRRNVNGRKKNHFVPYVRTSWIPSILAKNVRRVYQNKEERVASWISGFHTVKFEYDFS